MSVERDRLPRLAPLIIEPRVFVVDGWLKVNRVTRLRNSNRVPDALQRRPFNEDIRLKSEAPAIVLPFVRKRKGLTPTRTGVVFASSGHTILPMDAERKGRIE